MINRSQVRKEAAAAENDHLRALSQILDGLKEVKSRIPNILNTIEDFNQNWKNIEEICENGGGEESAIDPVVHTDSKFDEHHVFDEMTEPELHAHIEECFRDEKFLKEENVSTKESQETKMAFIDIAAFKKGIMVGQEYQMFEKLTEPEVKFLFEEMEDKGCLVDGHLRPLNSGKVRDYGGIFYYEEQLHNDSNDGTNFARKPKPKQEMGDRKRAANSANKQETEWPSIQHKSDRLKDDDLFIILNYCTYAKLKAFVKVAKLIDFDRQGSLGPTRGKAYRDKHRVHVREIYVSDHVPARAKWEAGLEKPLLSFKIRGETVFYGPRNALVAKVPPTEGMFLFHIHGDKCMWDEAQNVSEGIKYILQLEVASYFDLACLEQFLNYSVLNDGEEEEEHSYSSSELIHYTSNVLVQVCSDADYLVSFKPFFSAELDFLKGLVTLLSYEYINWEVQRVAAKCPPRTRPLPEPPPCQWSTRP